MKIQQQALILKVFGSIFFFIGFLSTILVINKMINDYSNDAIWGILLTVAFIFIGWAQFHGDYVIFKQDTLEVFTTTLLRHSLRSIPFDQISKCLLEEKSVYNGSREFICGSIYILLNDGKKILIKENIILKKQTLIFNEIQTLLSKN